MSVCDAPQWLESEWLRSCREIGVTDDARVEETGRRLLNRWCRADRHFHNIRHLADVLQRIDEMAPELQRPALVRLAAFYHGVVFDARETAEEGRAGEDEVSSAALAESELLGLGVAPDKAQRVAALVMALHDHFPHVGDGDCAALRDAEFATLSVEPQRYADYLRELRDEYSGIDLRDFLVARQKLLQVLLKKETIFKTRHGQMWEDAARQNMAAELHRVTKELGRVDAARALLSADGQPFDDQSTDAQAAPSSTAP